MKRRAMPLDLDEILDEPKNTEPVKVTSVRFPASTAKRLTEVARSRGMTVTRLIQNLVGVFLRDYEAQKKGRSGT